MSQTGRAKAIIQVFKPDSVDSTTTEDRDELSQTLELKEKKRALSSTSDDNSNHSKFKKIGIVKERKAVEAQSTAARGMEVMDCYNQLLEHVMALNL